MPFRFRLMLAGALLFNPALAWAEEASDDDGLTILVKGNGIDELDFAHGTKTGTPLLDTPQSVAILGRDQLDDQGVEQLNDALRYVPGVTLGQGEGHRDQVIMRGQASTADFFLDGLRDDAQYYRPLYNTQQIEVLKGANALLFGRGGGGGVINRVSKVADPVRQKVMLSGGIDTFGAWSLSGDLNQPLSDKVALRLNATYEELDNHRDRFSGSFIGAAPTVTAELGETTRLTLGYEFDRDLRLTDRGVPSLGGAPITGYDKVLFGSADINRSTVDAHVARARIDHEFSDNLSVNVSAQYAHYDKYYANILPSAASAATVTLTGYDNAIQRGNWIGQVNLVWAGETGGIKHTVLAGVEASDQSTTSTRRDARFANGLGGTTASTTVALGQTLTLPAITWTPINRSSDSSVRSVSAYVQDQIELTPWLQVIGGIRHDSFRISSLNLINAFSASRSDAKWSPRLGLVLKPQANISLYASFAKSFLPQSGDQFAVLDATTATLAPEEFRNLELGAKWDITPRLVFTAAAFQVDRSNTRANDPLTGNPVLTGKNRVRGLEAGLSGRITPSWKISLGYTYQQGEIRSTTTAAPAGRQLDKLPHHQFSVWNRYDVTGRLGVGLGVVHQSSQFATISNAVRLPAFTRIDAALFYDVSDTLALQLNIENLTDTRYYPSAHTDNNIATGEPLNAKVTLRVKF